MLRPYLCKGRCHSQQQGMAGQRRFSFSLTNIFGGKQRKEAIQKQRDLYSEEDAEGRHHQHQQHFECESENSLHYKINQMERSQREVLERLEKQETQMKMILQNQQKIIKLLRSSSINNSSQKPRPTQTVSLSRATGMSQALQLRQPKQRPNPFVFKAASGL